MEAFLHCPTAPATIRDRAAAMLSTMRDHLALSRAYLSAYMETLGLIPTAFVNEPRDADGLLRDAEALERLLAAHTRHFPRLLRSVKRVNLCPPAKDCSPRRRADGYLLQGRMAQEAAHAALDAHIGLLKQLIDCGLARQPELDSARCVADETRRLARLMARQHSFYSEA